MAAMTAGSIGTGVSEAERLHRDPRALARRNAVWPRS